MGDQVRMTPAADLAAFAVFTLVALAGRACLVGGRVAECDPHGLPQLPLPPSLPRATLRDHTFGIQRRCEVCAGVEVEWRINGAWLNYDVVQCKELYLLFLRRPSTLGVLVEATLNQNAYGTVLGDLRNPLIPTKTRSNHVQGCSFASLTCHLRGNVLQDRSHAEVSCFRFGIRRSASSVFYDMEAVSMFRVFVLGFVVAHRWCSNRVTAPCYQFSVTLVIWFASYL